jgi:hypothetical protein
VTPQANGDAPPGWARVVDLASHPPLKLAGRQRGTFLHASGGHVELLAPLLDGVVTLADDLFKEGARR